MRFGGDRCSPSKGTTSSPLKRTPRANHSTQQKTFIHYNNAIYMGALSSYKRNGQGIILLDNGTCAIVDSCYDSLTGHNIFIKEDTIVSLLHLRNGSYEYVLRTECFVLKIPYYDCEDLANGNGVLVDFRDNRVYHLVYQLGRLIKKVVETNKEYIRRVKDGSLRNIIDSKHVNAIRLNFNCGNGVKGVKKNGKINIGFFDQYGNLDGVCFKLSIDEEKYDKFDQTLKMKCNERGFYIKSRLENYGERFFKNGNSYIGQFMDDHFSGRGLLMYPAEAEGKWVFGYFQKNKLVKMTDMCLGVQDKSKPSKNSPKYLLKKAHEENTVNWIGNRIDLIDWDILQDKLSEALCLQVTDVAIEKQKVAKEEKKRLEMIQNHFSEEQHSQEVNRFMKDQKEMNGVLNQKLVMDRWGKYIQIEPRSAQNQQIWFTKKQQKDDYETKRFNRNISQRRLNLRQISSSLERYQTAESTQKHKHAMTPQNKVNCEMFRSQRRVDRKFGTAQTQKQ